MTNNIRARILLIIAAGGLIFPAVEHVRNQPQKERALLMAALVNTRLEVYANSNGVASVYRDRIVGLGSKRFSPGWDAYAYYDIVPATQIDTNDFNWFRSSRTNLQKIKDAWKEDSSWRLPPTVVSNFSGSASVPVLNSQYDIFQSLEIPTNIFEYTPYRLLSGVGPYTNDVALRIPHGFANANTANGGPVDTSKRAEWYTTDYGYDTTWALMTNMTYSARCIEGRLGRSEPFYTDGSSSGQPVSLSQLYLESGRVSYTATQEIRYVESKLLTETNSINPQTFEQMVECLEGGTNGVNISTFVWLDGFGGFRGSGLVVPPPPAVTGTNKYPWIDRLDSFGSVTFNSSPRGSIGSFTSTGGSCFYTNNVGDFVSRDDGILQAINTTITKGTISFFAVNLDPDAFPADNSLIVGIYSMSARANSNEMNSDDGLTGDISSKWGGSTDTYTRVGEYLLSATNNTAVLISSTEAPSSSFTDVFELEGNSDAHVLRTHPLNPPLNTDVWEAKGWALDNMAITIELYLEEPEIGGP